ncbi:unnamed protein product [Caenorhabditis auriculariae]|uniref:Uncharacterized protein n=1 Tax=Caenorhabditis auriculariae TaxID=2777116 RepID=A0A8S1HVW3_9PELO|nr:unnamed protein product [Caenorhabditis auriculariae]
MPSQHALWWIGKGEDNFKDSDALAADRVQQQEMRKRMSRESMKEVSLVDSQWSKEEKPSAENLQANTAISDTRLNTRSTITAPAPSTLLQNRASQPSCGETATEPLISRMNQQKKATRSVYSENGKGEEFPANPKLPRPPPTYHEEALREQDKLLSDDETIS